MRNDVDCSDKPCRRCQEEGIGNTHSRVANSNIAMTVICRCEAELRGRSPRRRCRHGGALGGERQDEDADEEGEGRDSNDDIDDEGRLNVAIVVQC